MPPRRQALLIQSLEPVIKSGWDSSIQMIRRLARLNAVESWISEGNFADLIRSLGISEARYLLDMVESVREAYKRAGQAYMDRWPPQIVDGRRYPAVFNIQNPDAERFLRSVAGEKITGQISQGQREAVRVALDAGMARGDNPRRTALNIVGRIDRATGRRSGGVLGLTEQMATSVERARAELLSGNPGQLNTYLTRSRRDRRFDALVQRALRDGTPVGRADVERMMARYSDRLLQLRGETIARTETQRAVGHAALQSLRQGVEDGVLDPSQIKRVWRSSGRDGRTRGSHLEMEGQPVGLEEAFRFPAGGSAMFPGDDSLGAPAAETINCRCRVEEQVEWSQ